MLRDAGLVDVDNELSGTVTHGGDPYREWWRASYELTKQTVPFDEIFGGRTSEFLTLNDDPFLDHIGWMVVGAWGIKPPA
jgi:hypothetical protein